MTEAILLLEQKSSANIQGRLESSAVQHPVETLFGALAMLHFVLFKGRGPCNFE